MKRILDVWRERKIFQAEFLDLLEEKAGIRNKAAVQQSTAVTTSIAPKLKVISSSLSSLSALDASKLGAITRVNAIRSKLYEKQSFSEIHGSNRTF